MNDPIDSREPLFSKDGNTSVPTDGDLRLDNTESEAFHKDFSVDSSPAHQPSSALKNDANLSGEFDAKLTESNFVGEGFNTGFPPMEELAQFHLACHKYGSQNASSQSVGNEGTKRRVCKCCGFTEPVVLPLQTPSIGLLAYGLSIPLSFDVWKFAMCVFGLAVVLAGPLQYEIVAANCRGGLDPHSFKPYPCGIFTLGTYININAKEEEQLYVGRNKYGWLSMMIFYVLHKLYISREKKLIKNLKKEVHLLSDHTVMVWNLYPSESNPEYVRQVLQHDFDGVLPEPIAYNFTSRGGAANCAKQHVLSDVEEKIKIFQSSLDSGLCSQKTQDMVTARLKSLAKERKQALPSSDSASAEMDAEGVAFVTFAARETQEQVCRVGVWKRSLYFWGRCCYKRKVHYVTSAYEPDDIRWNKIGFTKIQTWCTEFWLYLVFIVGFVLAFFANLVFITWCLDNKQRIVKQAQKQNTKLGLFNMASVYSFLIPVGGAIINSGLGKLIQFVASTKAHISQSQVLSETILRQSEVEFILVASLYTLTHYSMEAVTDYTILSEMVFNYFLFNIINTPIGLATPWLIARLKQILVGRKLQKFQNGQTDNPGVALTQKELNKVYENPPMDLAKRYSPFFKTIFLAAYYLELVPSCALLTLIYLVVQYWADKYMILRNYCPPIRLNELYSKAMSKGLRIIATYLFMGRITMYMDLVQWSKSSQTDARSRAKVTEFTLPAVTLMMTLILFPIMQLFGNIIVSLTDLLIKCISSCCCRSKKSPQKSARTNTNQDQTDAASLQNSVESSRVSSSDINFLSAQALFDITYEQVNPMTKSGMLGI